MYKRAHKTQGHVCESVCVEGSSLEEPNSTKPYVFSGPRSLGEVKNENKKTFRVISHLELPLSRAVPGIQQWKLWKNVIFPLGPSSNTKGAPDLQTLSCMGLLKPRGKVWKIVFPQKTVNWFHAAHSMWNGFKHKQALFNWKSGVSCFCRALKGRASGLFSHGHWAINESFIQWLFILTDSVVSAPG